MTEIKGFTIDKVSWHTQTIGNPESPIEIKARFRIVVDFLQQNGLTRRQLLNPGEEPTNDFAIHSTDLTEEGLAVIKRGYDRWLKKIVNKRKDVSDVRILSEALTLVRGE